MARNTLRLTARRWAALCGAVLFGCTWGDVPTEERCVAIESIPAGALVAVRGRNFAVGDTEFVPRGIGSYPLLEHAGNGRLEDVDEIFDQARDLGRPLVRTGAFFMGGNNPARLRDADGSVREEGLVGLDRLLYEAQQAGVRLILVLANNWSDYGGAPAVVAAVAPGEPKDAFWSDPRAVGDQIEFVRTIVTRTNSLSGTAYAEDPTVFAWELVNEARCTTPGYCDANTLVAWSATMSQAVRAAGAQQPIAWGGSGHLGEHGENLARIAESGGVDVLTLHVYPFSGNTLHLGGGNDVRATLGAEFGLARIRQAARLARTYDMPLLVEELGWRPDGGSNGDAERALVLASWLGAADEEQIGALPWMIAELGRPNYDGLLIRPTDRATYEVLRCE